MKKFSALFSALLLTASITACGTADVNDINGRRMYNVNNNDGIYDVNYRDVDDVYDVNDRDDVNDVYDTNRLNDRNIYDYRMKDSPLRNDPEANTSGNLIGPDRDDTIVNDEAVNPMKRTYNNR